MLHRFPLGQLAILQAIPSVLDFMKIRVNILNIVFISCQVISFKEQLGSPSRQLIQKRRASLRVRPRRFFR